MAKTTILFDMVTIETYPYPTPVRDIKIHEIKRLITNSDKISDTYKKSVLIEYFSESYVYTKSIQTNWPDSYPDDYKSFDKISEFISSNQDRYDTAVEAYLYAIENLGTEHFIEWYLAVKSGIQQWKPVREKTNEETSDPK